MLEKPADADSSTSVTILQEPSEKDLFTENFVISSWIMGENPSQVQIDSAWEEHLKTPTSEERVLSELDDNPGRLPEDQPYQAINVGIKPPPNPSFDRVAYRRETGKASVPLFSKR